MTKDIKSVLILAAVVWSILACNFVNRVQTATSDPGEIQGPVEVKPPPQEVTQPAQDAVEITRPAPQTVEPTPNNIFMPSINSNPSGEQAAPTDSEGEPTVIPPDPHVEIQADKTELKVGDTLRVTGIPIEIGMPNYDLIVRDEGVQDAPPLARVTYENQATPAEGKSAVLEFISAEGKIEQVIFILRAKAAGVTTITINATGEIHSGGPGSSASWRGSASGSVLITVSQ